MKLLQVLRGEIKDLYLRACYKSLRHAFNIESHITYEERVTLYRLSKKANHILEIGSYIGASACCFAAAANKNIEKKVICIDTWNNNAMTEGERDTWSEFRSNTSDVNDSIIPVRGFSAQVVDQVKIITKSIDLLFIDGDHSYPGVKADWDVYRNFLHSGSIVVFHDYGWAEGVVRVVHEEVMPLVSTHYKLPNMWWGFLGNAK